MCRWTNRLRRDASGFTLVEVMVALAIFAVLAASTIPLFIGAMRASVAAKAYTQAKNIAQQRIESMRQMPFHIDASNQKDGSGNSVPAAAVDLLDQYYPNLSPASAASTVMTATQGFVAAGAPRLAGEPTGPFYRRVDTVILPGDQTQFRVVVATQFLNGSGAGTVVVPSTGYNYADVNGRDVPPATTVGVTVHAAWGQYGNVKTHRTFTRINQAQPQYSLINAQARSQLLKVVSSTDALTQVTADLAAVSVDGASAAGITSAVDAVGATVGSSTSGASSLSGARNSWSAPQTKSLLAVSDSAGIDLSGGCATACVGRTEVSGGRVSVDRALPSVGYQSDGTGAPFYASIAGPGSSGRPAFRFSNFPNRPDLSLQSGAPVVSLKPGMSQSTAQASGYAGLWASSLTSAQRGVTALAGACGQLGGCPATPTPGSVIDVLPTTHNNAGEGLVRVELVNASLQCTTDGTSASVSAKYAANVYVWSNVDAAGQSQAASYRKIATITDGMSASPLPDPSSITVWRNSSGTDQTLDTWISSWSALVAPQTELGPGGALARATVDAVISLSTVPTRDGDDTSAISVQVAPMSCYVEDNR